MPRFFTKKRAGTRGRATGRAPQRAENPIAKEAQEGVKGEPSPGVPPFAGGLAARSLTHRHNAGGEQTLSGREFTQLAYTFAEYICLSLPVPPHFFGLAQRNGVEPQRKALGVVAPP